MGLRAEAKLASAERECVVRDVHVRTRSWPLSELGGRSAAAAAMLVLVDWITVCACLATARWLIMAAGATPIESLAGVITDLFLLAPWTLALAQARLYTRRVVFWDEARRVLYACTFASLFALGVAVAAQRLSLRVIALTWLLTVIAVPLMRYYTKRLLLELGLWSKRVLIIGAGETGRQVWERIRQSPDLGYEPTGYLDDDVTKVGHVLDGLQVYGPLTSLPDVIRTLGVKDVVVAIPRLPREQILHLIATCEGLVESIRLVPDLFGLASIGMEAEDLDGVLLLHMRWNLAKPWNLLIKRAFDLLIACVVSIVLLPFGGLIALAIRLDSPGPILFWQERMGRGRRHFRCAKFRTMYVDNEPRLHAHLAAHAEDRQEWDRFRKLRRFDPRVTRVGRALRRLSIDELPQLINVVRNEMSLVGPRPYLPEEADRMGDFRETVVKAPPGLTGLWQVSGRNNLTFDQRLRLDEYYVRNWSLWMDVVVLLKTITAVLQRHGAY